MKGSHLAAFCNVFLEVRIQQGIGDMFVIIQPSPSSDAMKQKQRQGCCLRSIIPESTPMRVSYKSSRAGRHTLTEEYQRPGFHQVSARSCIN